MQNKMSSTPPALANIGLHRVTQNRNRRFKTPKKLVTCSTDDELFVWRPQFRETNLANDQKMEEKGNENYVADDLEVSYSTPIAERLMNFLKGNSSHRWIWHEFGNCFVDAPILGGVYDIGSFMDEYLPQLKTRFLPRRGWQLLRRTLGKARRFSPAFIKLDHKELGNSDHSAGEQEHSKDPPFLEETTYSTKMLESIVRVKELMAIKKRALYEISLKNQEIQDNKEPKSRGSYDHFYTKLMYQRCFEALYRVNNDIVAPMTVLHEYVVQHRKESKESETRERTALEIYARCCRKAELDLKLAERNESLQLGTASTRELVLFLQTILNVTGELGGPNSADLLLIVDNLISHLLRTLPPELSVQLKLTMDELEPYRKRINDLFKIVPKEKATKDMQ